jgi:hypothetical protein
MSERGVALILVLLVMMTLSALSMSLAVMVSTESRVAANYRDGIEVLYGADAALERVLPDLAAAPDLNAVLAGTTVSTFIDGPAGTRRMPDGTFTDLRALTSMVNCGRPVCSDVDLDEVRDDRPWVNSGSASSRGARFAKLHTRLKVWRLGTENWEGGIP